MNDKSIYASLYNHLKNTLQPSVINKSSYSMQSFCELLDDKKTKALTSTAISSIGIFAISSGGSYFTLFIGVTCLGGGIQSLVFALKDNNAKSTYWKQFALGATTAAATLVFAEGANILFPIILENTFIISM